MANIPLSPYYDIDKLKARYQAVLTTAVLDRGITDTDKQWLETALLPDNNARAAQAVPMRIDRVQFVLPGKPPSDLLGSFKLSAPTVKDAPVFLYSLACGLEKHDDENALLSALAERLKDPLKTNELLRYVPVDQRYAICATLPVELEPYLVIVDAFNDLRQGLLDDVMSNLQGMGGELLRLPSIDSVLNDYLQTRLDEIYPEGELEPDDIHVNSFITVTEEDDHGVNHSIQSEMSSYSLTETVLTYYREGSWPTAQTREFRSWVGLEGAFVRRGFPPINNVTWFEALIIRASTELQPLFEKALEQFWSSPYIGSHTRRDYFADVLAQRFAEELRSHEYTGDISPTEKTWLAKVCQLPSNTSSSTEDPLRIDHLSYTAPEKNEFFFAGAFLVSHTPPASSRVFLYVPNEGLESFENRHLLKEKLDARQERPGSLNNLLSYLSLNEYLAPQGPAGFGFQGQLLTKAVFPERMDSIIGKQLANVRYLLNLLKKQHPKLDINDAIDYALDIRDMLDSRLPTLEEQPRWDKLKVSSEANILTPIEAPPAFQPSTVPHNNPTEATLRSLTALNTWINELRERRPTIRSFSQVRMQSYLTYVDSDLLSAQTHIEAESNAISATEPSLVSYSNNLTDLLIEQLTGYAQSKGYTGTGHAFRVVNGVQQALTSNQPDQPALQKMLDLAKTDFLKHYLDALKRFYAHTDTQGHSIKDTLIKIRYAALQHELNLRSTDQSLDENDRRLLAVVLDSPVRTMRKTLNGFRPDVYGIALSADEQPARVKLVNCFVIAERGSLGPGFTPEDRGRVVLWTPGRGLESYNSMPALLSQLNARLLDIRERSSLLDNVSWTDNSRILEQTSINIELGVIDGDFQEVLQQWQIEAELETGESLFDLAQICQLSAQNTLDSMLGQPPDIRAAINLDRLIVSAQNILFQQKLPDWLRAKSLNEQQEYLEALRAYRRSIDAGKNYLHDIPSLHNFARSKLETLLNAKDPKHPLNPDLINVTITHYESAVAPTGEPPFFYAANAKGTAPRTTESLTQFALKTYAQVNGAAIFISFHNSSLPVPAWLDSPFLQGVFRTLDIGKEYVKTLHDKLDDGQQGVDERKHLFATQLPAQLIEQALAMRLQDRLTEKAYLFVKQVITMPDDLAREPVGGVNIIVRPLELIPQKDLKADAALGMYLIGPRQSAAGPLILYTPYSKDYGLKEYRDEAHLISDLQTSMPLQALVLERMSKEVAKIYANGGFTEPHIPFSDLPTHTPGPISLSYTPYAGNFLNSLFTDNRALLISMAESQSVTAAQAKWERLKFLLTPVITAGFLFAPGIVTLPFVIWSNLQLVTEVAEAVKKGQWGDACDSVIMSLLQMLAMHQLRLRPVRAGSAAVEIERMIRPTGLDWADHPMTAEQITRLREFEVPGIDLISLQSDEAPGVYRNPINRRQYAPVQGRVYRIDRQAGEWRMINDDGVGPSLRRNQIGVWEITTTPLTRSIAKTLKKKSAANRAKLEMDFDAQGMTQITTRYPEKAWALQDAHTTAFIKLLGCRFVLRKPVPGAPRDPRVISIIKEALSISDVTPAHYDQIDAMTSTLLDALWDRSMNTYNSKRYVIGTTITADNVVAFSVPGDPERRIFFTEHFFDPSLRGDDYPVTGSFDQGSHARANTLIHELSHLVLGTKDLADAYSEYPPIAKLDTTRLGPFQTPDWIVSSRRKAFSRSTPAENLFKEPLNHTALETILNVSGTTNLNAARLAFLFDSTVRGRMILSNADSVALLISELAALDPALFTGSPTHLSTNTIVKTP
ncbi:dermonecrotic toxin domain-containing protein [Pseudomonas sp. H11T01]|uniref:dermonecrotic toxin domain-containing protein n=1 Tax=Pseudomonas sp. H11T01 TaxID=3402749 RepID=UPI003AC85B8F